MKTLVSTLVLSLSMAGMSYAQTIIYSQDFENTGGVMPSEINIIDGDNCDVPAPNQAYDVWQLADFSGDTALMAYSTFITSPCTASDWVIVNQSLSLGIDPYLAYKIGAATSGNNYETYKIYISTAGANTSDFLANGAIFIDSMYLNSSGVFTADTISLATYANQNVYIAFQYASTNKYLLALDNIVVYNDTTVSVSRINKANFMLYPNPANEAIVVQTEQLGRVEIYNILGQMVKQQQTNALQTNLHVGDLDGGMYVVKFTTETGIYTQQLRIE